MPKMFVISNPQRKKSRFIIRTESKNNRMTPTPLPQKPKLNSHFVTNTSSSLTVSNHVMKSVHMNQSLLNNNRQMIKKKLKFRFSVVKNYPQIEKRYKKAKDLKNTPRQNNKDQNYASGRWKIDEHRRFVEAIIKYGNDWKQVQRSVKTRSSTQARSHAQKFFVKIKNAKLLNFNLDLTKNSIKMLHDLVSIMSSEEYDKLITALNNVAFERRSEKRNKLSHRTSGNIDKEGDDVDNNDDDDEKDKDDDYNNNDINDCNSFPDINKTHDIFCLNQEMYLESNLNMMNPNSFSTNNCSLSTSVNDKPQLLPPIRQKRNSINSIEGFYHNNIEDKEKDFNFALINDKDYISSFNKTFSMEIDDINNERISKSRRMSIEDDFIYNYMKPKP